MFLFDWLSLLGFLAHLFNPWGLKSTIIFDNHNSPLVTVTNGTYRGLFIENYNQLAFLGIPYCQPPIGPLRFERPQSLNTSFTEIRNATDYSPVCYHSVAYGPGDNAADPISEDCLSLNIVMPNITNKQNLPVVVFFHGGSYIDGSSRRDIHNLTYFIQESVEIDQPIIAVSLNYRLSGFGFLASQQVADIGASNVGLRDQRLALEWVKENIGRFGGDPNHIILWGQSAGSSSVGYQLLAYGGQNDNLFIGAILQSAFPTTSGLYGITSEIKQKSYDQLISHFNCSNEIDTLNCLKKIDSKLLQFAFNSSNNIISSIFSGPVLDNDFLKIQPSIQLNNGDFVKVPLYIGTTTDEASLMMPSGVDNETILKYFPDKMPSVPKKYADKLIGLYPPNDPNFEVAPDIEIPNVDYWGGSWKRMASIIGDLRMIAPRRLLSNIFTQYDIPVYTYRWNVKGKGLPDFFGVTHCHDLSYFFINPSTKYISLYGYPWLDDLNAKLISKLGGRTLISFINHLHPNDHKMSHFGIGKLEDNNSTAAIKSWPVYSKDEKKNFVFNLNGVEIEDDVHHEEAIDYINSINRLFYSVIDG